LKLPDFCFFLPPYTFRTRVVIPSGTIHRRLHFLGRSIAMMKFSSTTKFAVLSAALLLAACTHKQEAVNTTPPPVSPPPPQQQAVTSSIIPGSAQDFKVNVGDTVHFALGS
jgi:hypothetical protein